MGLVSAIDGFGAGFGTILYVIFTPSGKHIIFITKIRFKTYKTRYSPLVIKTPSLILKLNKKYCNFAGLRLGLILKHRH